MGPFLTHSFREEAPPVARAAAPASAAAAPSSAGSASPKKRKNEDAIEATRGGQELGGDCVEAAQREEALVDFRCTLVSREDLATRSVGYACLAITPGSLDQAARALEIVKKSDACKEFLGKGINKGGKFAYSLATLLPCDPADEQSKPLGLHFTLSPAQKEELEAALRGGGAAAASAPEEPSGLAGHPATMEASFKPEEVCFWSTLSQWDPEAKKRKPCSLFSMLQTERFRTLHTAKEEAQIGLIVIKGHLIVGAGGKHSWRNMHTTLAGLWVPAADAHEGDTEAFASPDQVLPEARGGAELQRLFCRSVLCG